jgi:hypothetical protein
MLKDLRTPKIPITLGGQEMYLLYNLHSRAYLEEFYPSYEDFIKQDIAEIKVKDLLHLLRAGLIDCFKFENEKLLDNFDYKNVYPKLSYLGEIINEENLDEILLQIIDAFLNSLPAPAVGESSKKKQAE